MAQAQRHLGAGDGGVVALALEQFFDRVNQEKLMRLAKERVADRRVLKRIDRYRKAGAMTEAGFEATVEGTPPGGPLSPLLANLRLDERDKAVERRGHRFGRDADDRHIVVQSARAGQRVLASVTRCLAKRLTRAVKAAKSAVDRPWRRTFRGFPCTGPRPNRRRVSQKALEACKREGRQLTCRTRGVSLMRVVGELARYLGGWYAYVSCTEAPSSFRERDSWSRRRLRCSLWKQGGRQPYRELRRRGVSPDLAGHTVKSAQGPWRLSHSPALAIALPGSYCDGLGVPRLHRPSHR